MNEDNKAVNTPNIRKLLANFVIELIIYGILVTGYAFFVLRIMGDYLFELFNNYLIIYAFLGLGLIVAQGVLLDLVTTFLIDRLKFERFE